MDDANKVEGEDEEQLEVSNFYPFFCLLWNWGQCLVMDKHHWGKLCLNQYSLYTSISHWSFSPLPHWLTKWCIVLRRWTLLLAVCRFWFLLRCVFLHQFPFSFGWLVRPLYTSIIDVWWLQGLPQASQMQSNKKIVIFHQCSAYDDNIIC